MAVAGLANPDNALAQAVGELAPPPVRQSIDENGVDVIRGTYFPRAKTWLSIGPESGTMGLSLNRVGGAGGISSMLSAIKLVGSQTIVNIGTHSDSFTFNGSAYVSTEANGATLVGNGPYVYTARDGTVATFAANGSFQQPFYFSELGRLSSVVYPDGSGFSVTTKIVDFCEAGYDGATCQGSITKIARVQSLNSRNGYQLKVSYANNSAKPEGTTFEDWTTITSVKAINSAVEYCNPAADSCALVNPWPDQTAPPDFVTVTMSADRVATATNRGVTYTYAYADAGTVRTTTVTDPNGGVRTYVGDTSSFLLKSFKDELNRTTSYDHDAFGRVLKVTAPEGNYTQLTYDARGNISTTVQVAKAGSGLQNITTSAAYPATCTNTKICNKPTSTTDGRGAVTDYTYDATYGGVLTMTMPAPTTGAVRPQTRYTYAQRTPYFKTSAGGTPQPGAAMWVPVQVSACRTTASCAGGADEVKTAIDYGPQVTGTANNLLPVSVSSGAGDNSLIAVTSFTYDMIGNRTSIDGPLPAAADTTRTLYNAVRLPIGVIGPDPDGGGALKNRAQRLTYDGNRQVTLVEQGTTVGQTDAAWSAFAPLQSVASVYDANAYKLRDTVQAGGTSYAVQQYSYDTLGRPECSTTRMNSAAWGSLPASACTLAATGSFGPDRIVRTLYNAASQPAKVQSAYATPEQADDATYTYAANGKVASVTDGNGNPTAFAYDGHDRPWQTFYPNAAGGGVNMGDFDAIGYDLAGNVVQRRLRDGNVLQLSYDALNRLIQVTKPACCGPWDPVLYYSRDNLGRLLAATDANGHSALYAYDALGRVTSEGNYFGASTAQYDLAGRRTRLTWSDGLYAAYDRLVTGEVTAVRENGAVSGVGVLATFTHDDLGRRTALARGNGASTAYGYDPVSRLTSLSDNLASSTWDRTSGFAYNPAGQIASRTRDNDLYAWNAHFNRDIAEVPDGLNRLVTQGTTALGHDARGNVTAIGGTAHGYTSLNQLAYLNGAQRLSYDPVGRLDYELISNTLLLSAGASIVAEQDGTSQAFKRRYVPGPGTDETLLWYEGTGTTDRRWLHSDERGSVVAISDASGNATAINRYDEYGVPAATNVGRFQYTGQAWLPELGMHYYKARIYNPKIGRFMQTDPIGYGDGMNLYAYVGGDPVNRVDPMGLCDATPDRTMGPNDCVKPIDTDDIVVNGDRCGTFPELCAQAFFDLDRIYNFNWRPAGGGGGGFGTPQSGPFLEGYKRCTAPFLCQTPEPDYCSNADFRTAKGADNLGKTLTAAGAVATFIPIPAVNVAGRIAAGIGGAMSLGSNVYLARNYPDISRNSSIAASLTAGALIDRAGAGAATSIFGGQAADLAIGAAGFGDPCG